MLFVYLSFLKLHVTVLQQDEENSWLVIVERSRQALCGVPCQSSHEEITILTGGEQICNKLELKRDRKIHPLV